MLFRLSHLTGILIFKISLPRYWTPKSLWNAKQSDLRERWLTSKWRRSEGDSWFCHLVAGGFRTNDLISLHRHLLPPQTGVMNPRLEAVVSTTWVTFYTQCTEWVVNTLASFHLLQSAKSAISEIGCRTWSKKPDLLKDRLCFQLLLHYNVTSLPAGVQALGVKMEGKIAHAPVFQMLFCQNQFNGF